ncbi:MAG: efflux RND transporter periplasmic adaptor subunit [Vicinamibacteria bacterium]|nr:efflux RND transporter periplasmic adaptor subunit [Vicinamibacteria bacterium]
MRRIGILVSLILLNGACGRAELPAAVIPAVRAGLVEEVQPQGVERYSATIAPIEQIDLVFKSTGVVERIAQVRGADSRLRDVQAGDKVAKGTELAAVRARDYEQKLEQAQGLVGQAEAQLAQAEASARQATLDFERTRALFESASVTKPQFDQAQSRFDSAGAAVRGAQAALSSARASADQASLALRDATLRAPLSGWITARNIQRGGMTSGSSPAFSMMDSHLVKAVFALPDVSLKGVRLGQHQSVVLDAAPAPLEGVVTSIAPQADPKGRVFLVEVTIANTAESVRPGMIGTLLFGSPERPLRLVIPLAAVVKSPARPDGFAVFRVRERDGKAFAEAQDIQIGDTYGNAIEVTSGLAKGDRVVVLGGSLLRNGQEVRLLP